MRNVIDVLKERGFIEAMTSDELLEIAQKPLKVYCGFDPTGDSLHLGHLVALMGLCWFQRFGHCPVAIIGGATGMIGDPSGKSTERSLLDEEAINCNIQGIRKNIECLLDFSTLSNPPLILNNLDWFKEFSFVNFLRDVGKYFRIGPMLAKDSVKLRLSSEEGMSFTEFSYQLLQGYDFLYLYDHYQVNVQLGGSDQWGNITAGTELIRKVRGGSSYGITFPLLTRSDGQKFGKSEKGAIWLSPERCSPYEFYQYLIRVADADVIKLMSLLTFMDIEEIRKYEQAMQNANYIPNTAQKRLAEEVTKIVHGQKGLDVALKVTLGISPGSKTSLDVSALEIIAQDLPNFDLSMEEIIGETILNLLVRVSLQSSKSVARKSIRNGGVYLNNIRVTDENAIISENDLIEGRLLILAVGKLNKVLIKLKNTK